MLTYIKGKLSERSTIAGIVAILLAVALLVVPLVIPAEKASLVSTNIQWLIGALFIGGIGGVLFPEKKAPCE